MLTKLTGNDFEEKVCAADKPVVVLIYGDFDPVSSIMKLLLDEVSKDFEKSVSTYALNVEDNYELSTSLKVRTLPTTLYFDKCEMAYRFIGAVPKYRLFGAFDFFVPKQISDVSTKPKMAAWLSS